MLVSLEDKLSGVPLLGGGFKYVLFSPLFGQIPILTDFFRWVETTNQTILENPRVHHLST